MDRQKNIKNDVTAKEWREKGEREEKKQEAHRKESGKLMVCVCVLFMAQLVLACPDLSQSSHDPWSLETLLTAWAVVDYG